MSFLFIEIFSLSLYSNYKYMKSKIIVQPNDIILDRFDTNHFIQHQGGELVKYLKDWEHFIPVGGFPHGSYTILISPIFSSKEQFDKEIIETQLGINKLIEQLNLNNQSVSRIECCLEQSDDMDALQHPINGGKGQECRNEKYIDNEDYKNGNWVFEYIMTSARMTNQYGTASAYGNRFDVETNDKCQITKKYFILKIKSSWNSI